MARPENETIAALDDANAAQQLIRHEVRQLVDEIKLNAHVAARLERVIRATERTQAYLKHIRSLERKK